MEDTDAGIRARRDAAWRTMPAAAKAALFDRWSTDIRRLAAAGARQRLPDASERDILIEVARAAYGEDVVRRHGLLPPRRA